MPLKMDAFYKYIVGLSLLSGLVGLTACNNDDELDGPTGPANRTVLVYMMAENRLSSYAEQDIDEMIQGAPSIPDNDHLIVFLDDANTSRNPRIYEIKKATSKVSAQAEVVKEYSDDVCSTDPAVLEEVLAYVKQYYPANSYGLVMWSHGGGWLPAATGHTKDTRTIGVDNEQNSASDSGIEMEISALAEVLANFGRLDFLYFDACYMQGIEVVYELKDVADYVIGCPAVIPAIGAKYDCILSPMFAQTADIEGIVMNNYNYYLSVYEAGRPDEENYGCLMSAVKCDELETLAEMTAPIIASKASGGNALPVGSGVQTYRSTSSWPEFYDFRGVMYSLSVAGEYDQWLAQFAKAVPYQLHTERWHGGGERWLQIVDESISPYGGISMYVPKSSYSYSIWNEAFQKTRWYQAVWKNTGW